VSERLVEFLYILARDELPIGKIESIMWDHVTGGEPDEFCNPWLEAWARNLVERLTNDEVPVVNYNNMYKQPGELEGVLGPDAKEYDRPAYPKLAHEDGVLVVRSGKL
jgi:hypothetical protein